MEGGAGRAAGAASCGGMAGGGMGGGGMSADGESPANGGGNNAPGGGGAVGRIVIGSIAGTVPGGSLNPIGTSAVTSFALAIH